MVPRPGPRDVGLARFASRAHTALSVTTTGSLSRRFARVSIVKVSALTPQRSQKCHRPDCFQKRSAPCGSTNVLRGCEPDVRPFAPAFPTSRRHARKPLGAGHRWGRTRRSARCVICGLRLCPEDAIGLVPEGTTHAECALVHMLESQPLQTVRDDRGVASSSHRERADEEQWRALLRELFADEP
jgi:hypothetical protein